MYVHTKKNLNLGIHSRDYDNFVHIYKHVKTKMYITKYNEYLPITINILLCVKRGSSLLKRRPQVLIIFAPPPLQVTKPSICYNH